MRAGARAVVSRRGVRDSASLRLGVVRPAADRRGAVRHGEHLQHPQTHPLLHHQLAPRSAAADARPPGQRRSVVCRSVCLSDTLASAAQKRLNRSRSRSAAWSTTCCASWSWRWSSASRSRPASTSSTGSGEPSRRGRERSAGLETQTKTRLRQDCLVHVQQLYWYYSTYAIRNCELECEDTNADDCVCDRSLAKYVRPSRYIVNR